MIPLSLMVVIEEDGTIHQEGIFSKKSVPTDLAKSAKPSTPLPLKVESLS
jgi:hypothetical protein